MGSFLTAQQMKERTDSALIKSLEVDDIDDRFVIPAERALEGAFALALDTDNIPWHWRHIFLTRPDLDGNFQEDFRRATIALVNFWADNPHAYSSQSVGGSSVTYSAEWPEMIGILMGRWRDGGAGGGRSGVVRRG